MSREITKDCDKLIYYLKEYDLTPLCNNNEYIIDLKSMHKKVYGYLLFTTELEQQNQSISCINDMVIDYFKESGSDMMQSVFSWANGSYKSSKLLLRSSIETFVKACIGNDDQEVFEEKSLYKLFDTAKDHSYFSGDPREKYFERIHNSYKVLCMTAHSAPTIDLASISAMKILPRYDAKASKEFSKLFTSTIEAMLSTAFLNYHSTVNNMHLFNRSIFLSSLSLTSKREISEYISEQAMRN
ncbi:hypothetical protein M4D70_17280 [Brevibacillus borstelensis]|uniref:hypothetical protein n=1 Tax=Brevibacillus borstelensis TaxID=45462 RepID=UPI002040D11C|nr:hypothetical protein [Brevibacillus borstelensis]MCM3623982.1 hypothetical protein [Brevibacillus borstelensis]